MDFVNSLNRLSQILKQAYDENYTAEQLEEKLAPDGDEVITKLMYMHTTTPSMRLYLSNLYPMKQEHFQNCSMAGLNSQYFSHITQDAFHQKYADYPTWMSKKKHTELKGGMFSVDKFMKHFKIKDVEGADTDGVVEDAANVAEEMICLDINTFQKHGPRNGKKNCKDSCYMLKCECFRRDWFTEECGYCGDKIRDISHVIRYPVPGGGWSGCYCKMSHMIDDSPHDVEFNIKRVFRYELMSSQLDEYGINDRHRPEYDEEEIEKSFEY